MSIDILVSEVGLADTSGDANTAQVKDLVRRVQAAVGDHAMTGLHLHNTRGLGLANVVAGLPLVFRPATIEGAGTA
jgi:hydroxymethylglutaryl-CoA lyase